MLQRLSARFKGGARAPTSEPPVRPAHGLIAPRGRCPARSRSVPSLLLTPQPPPTHLAWHGTGRSENWLRSAESQGLRARWRTWAARRGMASVTVSSGSALPAVTPTDASSRSGLVRPPTGPPRPPASRAAPRPRSIVRPRRPWPLPRSLLGPFLALGGGAVPGARPPAALSPWRRRAQEPDPGFPGAPIPVKRPSESASTPSPGRQGPRVGAGGEGRGAGPAARAWGGAEV